MNKEIKKRKRRFWAMCLAAVLALCSMEPLMVEAASYIEEVGDYEAPVINGDYIYPGDVFYALESNAPGQQCTIAYYDVSGTEIQSIDIVALGDIENIDGKDYHKYVVLGYTDVGGTEIDPSLFICWEVAHITTSAGGNSKFCLRAVKGVERNITYHLDGGNNNPANPATYFEGRGVSELSQAAKDNYVFAGWYTDPSFAAGTKVTSISTKQSGDLDLYAKFTAVQSSPNNNNSGNITPFNWYSMEGGGDEGGTWVHGSRDGLTVRGLGELWKFTGVKIDGNLIDRSNYSTREGSTIVTLSPEYLNTLGTGTHTLEMQWTDGLGETTFTIVAAQTSPKTGDDVPGICLPILTFTFGIGMLAAWNKKNRKESAR